MKLLISLLLLLPFAVSANVQCQRQAEVAEMIRTLHDKGVPKERVLIVFQGNDKANRIVRDIIHSIYRGDTDALTPSEIRQFVYDVCISK